MPPEAILLAGLAMALATGVQIPAGLGLGPAAALPGIAMGALLSPPVRRWLHGPRLRWAILGIATAGGIALVLAG